MNKENILNILLIVGLVVAGVIVGIGIDNYFLSYSYYLEASGAEYDNYSSSVYLTQLENDVIKYIEYVKPYYFYNKSNTGRALSIDRLKKQGGVCNHYAVWYANLSKQDGYYAITTRMQIKDSIDHKMAIISSDDSYCIIDQMNYWCLELTT